MSIASDIRVLRELLLEYVDANENLELHLDRGTTCGLMQAFDDIISRAEGGPPAQPPVYSGSNIVSLSEMRAKLPKRQKI